MADAVLIIGAGVSGLAFAQGLLKNGIPFRIFERDQDFHSRAQGYRVRVSKDGIQALRDNLPPAQFDILERSCAVVTGVNNAPSFVLDATTANSAAPLFKPGQAPPAVTQMFSKPWSVDRSVLREVLRQNLESHIDFGKGLESFTQDDEGVQATFTDGSTARGSILVGADGTWSRVRQQVLPSYRLADSEGRLIFGKTPITDELMQHFSPEASSGLTLLRGDTLNCLLEPMRFTHDDPSLPTPADYVYWVLMMRAGQHMPDEQLLHLNVEETLQMSRNLTATWHESFKTLFTQLETTASATRVLTSRPSALPTAEPAGVASLQHARVTLLGDAAHPMAPTAALGATTALKDAATLVRHLVASGDIQAKTAATLKQYEADMNEYASAVVTSTLGGGRALFGMKDFDQLPMAA